MNNIPQWIQSELREYGFGCNPEWSTAGKLGQTYVLIKGKFEARVPEDAIGYFLQGYRIGKLCSTIQP